MVEINGMNFPLDRKYYTKNGAHIWLREDGGVVRIGMDAFAAEMIGLLTFLQLDKRTVESGEAVGSFESAKFVSRFYTPISGEIVEVNEEAVRNPRKVNEDPYDAWLVAIAPVGREDGPESEFILETEEEISAWITDEVSKLEGE